MDKVRPITCQLLCGRESILWQVERCGECQPLGLRGDFIRVVPPKGQIPGLEFGRRPSVEVALATPESSDSQPMGDTRPWYREPETFIAITALVVSVSAVAVGLYEASLQRAHDRAEVWPHVELSTFTDPNGTALLLENTGIGPAVIKSVTVTVDGTPAANWTGVLQTLLGRDPVHSSTTVVDHGLRAGDKATLIALGSKDVPPDFSRVAARVSVAVCYASVFDEYWFVSSDHLGGTSYWRRVHECPRPMPGTDF